MKTKQEIIDFLESKVGTKVKCIGNDSLSGQCVTLIKALMEFLGVKDPYQARGHAKTCISAYINEKIAQKGAGFLTVFSNKDMGGGYGHIWCNAGEGKGTFYESNGVKPLLVTKGKTYTYDNVCNFDSYIKEDTTSDLQKQFDAQKITLADVTRQRDELDTDNKKKDKLIEEITAQLNEAKASSEGFRNQFNQFVAELAGKLGTRQEVVEIIASIDTCLEYEDKADKLDRQIELERKEHEYAVKELEKKIATLESNLESLKADFKALKDTQITPINPVNKFSIISIIKKILGI